MFRVALILLSTRLLYGQTSQSPQELLKEAVAFHQQGKLEEAIRDYDLFLDIYPDVHCMYVSHDSHNPMYSPE